MVVRVGGRGTCNNTIGRCWVALQKHAAAEEDDK